MRLDFQLVSKLILVWCDPAATIQRRPSDPSAVEFRKWFGGKTQWSKSPADLHMRPFRFIIGKVIKTLSGIFLFICAIGSFNWIQFFLLDGPGSHWNIPVVQSSWLFQYLQLGSWKFGSCFGTWVTIWPLVVEMVGDVFQIGAANWRICENLWKKKAAVVSFPFSCQRFQVKSSRPVTLLWSL